ncbi:MAG: hypothetical protein Sapg2KO_15460 [Saprospiraceae bacterium]
MNCKTTFLLLFLTLSSFSLQAEHSVARLWNEVLLTGIRNDFARPTVHARNLFHSSVLMYDAWAAYDEQADPYFLGNVIANYPFLFDGVPIPTDVQAAQEEAISYGMYRLILHRFEFSPGVDRIYEVADSLMNALSYDPNYTSSTYQNGNPADLGNYLAKKIIEFGFLDGSNEAFDYLNFFYDPVNLPLITNRPGNPNISDLNHWQPLTLDEFIDQAGNPIPFNTPDFLGPEWGWVVPFSLPDSSASFRDRDGGSYLVHKDPGPPPYLDTTANTAGSDQYKWGFSLVAVWGAHLDPTDTTMWDISPASIGNMNQLPTDFADYPQFYNLIEGGDPSQGHELNPVTGQPYEPQMVPRADYARVLAEFWADGPDSETPPGHWFTILNYVNDNPLLEKRYRGTGEIIDDLEWDVKAYFLLGGTMHDCAISAWSIKGYYDYIRPISAIRGMGDLGQSSDPNLPNYHVAGLPLIPGYIELVMPEDIPSAFDTADLHKIKLYTWRGPDYINDPETDDAGVGWILAENWWPYQRPSFVTPPFAGYVSGHSTYSRGAAEVLTLLTGDPFFPGGMGEFEVKKNEFLVFEEGPTVDFTLQWATYQDASDQTSLSRIWGGIHPPADDIPGRLIGEEIGIAAFAYGEQYFNLAPVSSTEDETAFDKFLAVYPNPTQNQLYLKADSGHEISYVLYNQLGQAVLSKDRIFVQSGRSINLSQIPNGVYWLKVRDLKTNVQQVEQVIKTF